MAAGKTRRKTLSSEQTKLWLDEVLNEFSRKSFLYSDPLGFVHRYSRTEDQELIALVAALFSFGNVSSILKTLEVILRPLGDHPHKALLSLSKADFKKIWGRAYYRFYSSSDIIYLFERLQRILKEHHSFEAAFRLSREDDTLTALFRFRELFMPTPAKTPGLKFMFAHPFEGTAKRWHMFLRWVVRKDEVDLGIWKTISKSKLIQPLDTHLFQIGCALQLTTFKSPGLKAALQMTDKFRTWDAEDPIKYDFALCRLGVLKKRNSRLNSLMIAIQSGK